MVHNKVNNCNGICNCQSTLNEHEGDGIGRNKVNNCNGICNCQSALNEHVRDGMVHNKVNCHGILQLPIIIEWACKRWDGSQ